MKSGHVPMAGLFLFVFEILGLTAKNDGGRTRGIIW